jgi:hypothetical protein
VRAEPAAPEQPIMRRFLKDVHSEDEQSFVVVVKDWINNFSIGDLPAPIEKYKI